MKRYRIQVDGRTFDVQLLSDPRQNTVQVEVDGQAFSVGVEPVAASVAERAAEPVAGSGPEAAVRPAAVPVPQAPSGKTVTAPLPGVIKSLAVQPGQQVTPGATLLVIEAMKMDNVIRASREGVVETIHVAEGHRVAHGQVMLEYRA
ncbi:MAG: biotin/lipoyl-binding protein [Anaerolineae bacterium]|nr:biotin/lipoyl-binding protein [Anaerolineae bacterium]